MDHCTFPTTCADESTESFIAVFLATAPRMSPRARAPQLRQAKSSKLPRIRRRAHIQMLARQQLPVVPFPKERRVKWWRSVNAFTADKWAERRARGATAQAVGARL